MDKQTELAYELFGDHDGIYNYCPSPVLVDAETMVVFYCANTVPGLVIDDIYARKGKLGADGRWAFGEKFRVLEPSRLGWDCIHVCDPDVIRGEFHYNGEQYNWMMVYLGCDIHYCYHNQIGIAFAKQLEGPYVKYAGNPVVGYEETFHWGAGQAALISLDGKGKFRMVYSQTVHDYARHIQETHTFWRDCDFADANAPLIGEAVLLHEGGLENRRPPAGPDAGAEGAAPPAAAAEATAAGPAHDAAAAIPVALPTGPAPVANPTIVWDRERDLIYMTREGTPFDRTQMPDFIAPYTSIAVISREAFERNEGGWRTVYHLDERDTGFHRNHNAGLVKNAYGWHVPGGGHGGSGNAQVSLPVIVTVSALQEADFLWTYRLHYKEITFAAEAQGLEGRNV